MIYLILLLGVILRLISLNQSLWIDEATSALVVRDFTYSEIINYFSLGDFHPPFYYLLLKSWSEVFGTSEVGLRSLSVFLSVATIYVVYMIGNFVNKKVGILSAIFLAINGLHIYYSQEARMYVISTFFVTLAVYFFMKTLSENKSINWVFLALAIGLNSLTDYLPNLIIPVLWLAAIRLKKGIGWWRKFLISHLIIIVAWLWWFPYFLKQLSFGLSTSATAPLWWNLLGKTSIKNFLLVPVKFVFGRISFENDLIYFLLASLVLTVYLIIFLVSFRGLIKQKHTFLLWGILPVVVAASVGFRIPVFYYFRLLFVLPAFILILAASVIQLPKKFQNLAILFILYVSTASSLYYLLTPRFHREGWRGAVIFIEENSKNADYGVIFSSGKQYEAFKYYWKEGKT